MRIQLSSLGLFLWWMSIASTGLGQDSLSTAVQGYSDPDSVGLIQLTSCESNTSCYPGQFSAICEPKKASFFAIGAELPLLSAYANHGVGANNWFGDLDTTAAVRATAVYQSSGILGFRGRYFHFDAGSDANTTLKLDLYDLETTTGLELGDWSLIGAAGLRWGSIDFTSRFGGPVEDFDGFGFTLGADIRRSIAQGFSIYAGARQSMLYGESESVGAFNGVLENVVVPITEFRLGTEYTRNLRGGRSLTAGIGYEHQQLNGLSVRNIGIDPEDVDIALAGPVFSLGFTF